MAVEVIQTELPEQEVLQAFSAFALHAKCSPHNLQSTRDSHCFDRHLDRFALVADVPCKLFRMEFWALQPVAQAIYWDTLGVSHLDAWREALRRHSRKSWRGLLPSLQRCLGMYAAFHSCTTSNTERGFSAQSRIVTPSRGCMKNDLEHNEMDIVWNFDEA